jgi:hypothetical protein
MVVMMLPSGGSDTGVGALPDDAGRAAVAASPGGAAENASAPLTVATRPYAWNRPCGRRYLIDRPAAAVPAPPTAEGGAEEWVQALGAVSADGQSVELTVRPAGEEALVLRALRVRVVRSAAPVDWNAYSVGAHCSAATDAKNFGVDLDASRPSARPAGGQRSLPYRVSGSAPEVLDVRAAAREHDVSWYLELDWSSGDRRGSLRVDDEGKPFRTSATATASERQKVYRYELGGMWDRESGS